MYSHIIKCLKIKIILIKSSYTSALLGKVTSQLLRLAGIISEFYEVFKYENKEETQKLVLNRTFAEGLLLT